jgi:hypothetical protein
MYTYVYIHARTYMYVHLYVSGSCYVPLGQSTTHMPRFLYMIVCLCFVCVVESPRHSHAHVPRMLCVKPKHMHRYTYGMHMYTSMSSSQLICHILTSLHSYKETYTHTHTQTHTHTHGAHSMCTCTPRCSLLRLSTVCDFSLGSYV